MNFKKVQNYECAYYFLWVRKVSLTKAKLSQGNGTVEDIFA